MNVDTADAIPDETEQQHKQHQQPASGTPRDDTADAAAAKTEKEAAVAIQSDNKASGKENEAETAAKAPENAAATTESVQEEAASKQEAVEAAASAAAAMAAVAVAEARELSETASAIPADSIPFEGAAGEAEGLGSAEPAAAVAVAVATATEAPKPHVTSGQMGALKRACSKLQQQLPLLLQQKLGTGEASGSVTQEQFSEANKELKLVIELITLVWRLIFATSLDGDEFAQVRVKGSGSWV